MVHLPQKEVSTRMSKEELEECAMSCIKNNFKVLHLIKEDCFENYRAGTDEKRKIYLDEIKDCSHAVYNNLYMLFEGDALSIEKEKEIEKQVQDELLEIANFIIEYYREKFYEELKNRKR